MRRISLWMPGLAASVLAAGLLAVGCGGGKTGDKKTANQENKEDKAATKKKGKQVLAATESGTLKGKAVLDGPKPANLDEITTKLREQMAAKDKAHCLEMASDEEKSQFDWRISPDGGVANVVVWLLPPKGYIFKIDPSNKTWKDEVVMDQPHCAFEPHVVALFPSFTNPETKKPESTKQTFVVKNDAEILHNTNYKAPDGSAENFAIEPKRSKEIKFSPDDMRPIEVSCNVHPWMRAYVWAFDNPYSAVTDKDGNFEIKNVPAGVDVQLFAWHEKGGLQELGTRKFKSGDNTESIKVPSK